MIKKGERKRKPKEGKKYIYPIYACPIVHSIRPLSSSLHLAMIQGICDNTPRPQLKGFVTLAILALKTDRST